MAQLVETLAKIGIKAEGYRNKWDSLAKQTFPCIVHLANPDHYIVVSGMEPIRGYIHIFDDTGNRVRLRRGTFEKRWTGHSLHIQKDNEFFTKSSGTNPRAHYDYLILDKGDIPAVGEPTEFVFPIYNIGKSDLIIEDVKVNCGCLKSEKPTKPIRHGECGIIKLLYFVESKRGVFTQTAVVKTNDPTHPVVLLSACGFTGVEVHVEPTRINLDRFFVGRESTYRCFIRYVGEWNDFQVELETSKLVGAKLVRHEFVTLEQDDLIESDTFSGFNSNTINSESVAINKRVLELTFEPAGSVSEIVNGTIVLKTNISGYEHFTLQVSGTIKSPVQTFPSVIYFGSDNESSVTLVSLVDEPFRIVSIDCDSTISCHYDPSVLLKEQVLSITKNNDHISHQFIIKYQMETDVLPIDIPLTLCNHAF